MKATVTKLLNRRIGSPSVNAPKLTPLAIGASVEVAATVKGDRIDGNDVWYQTSEGYYVWSGGVENTEFKDGIIIQDYNKSFIQIPEIYRNTKGRGVKIAILDSGININHIAFTGAVKKQFVSGNSAHGIKDITGHGSHCAGIIGARKDKLIGVAPECDLLIAKIITDNDVYIVTNVSEGLQWAINEKVDVINISLNLSDSENNERFIDLLKQANENKIIIVASAGENRLLTNSFDHFFYPAMFDECISVGAISKIFLNNTSNPIFSDHLDYIMPFNDILSCSPIDNEYISNRGSSMAAAYISGICGLLKAKENNPNIIGKNEVKVLLDSFAVRFSLNIDLENNYQFFKTK